MEDNEKKIYVTSTSMPEFEEYVREIKGLWESRRLTNMGEKHRELESGLKDYLKVSNLTLFSNGHLALESAISALGLTGEVITTPFTFASTTHAIVRSGLKPVFCDINPDDYTMDTGKIENLVTENTCGIIPVHVYGNVCDVSGMERISRKHNLKVIYDAAHTFGVTFEGRGIGSFGDISMFSFHATKVFNTIEGGALSYGDPDLESVLKKLKNFGITGTETVELPGGNAKMNEFQAAMGICNLRHVREEIKKRKSVVERYNENMEGIKGIRLWKPQKGVESNYSYFPVVFDGYKYTRDEIFDKLKENNIYARKYFYPLTSDYDCYKKKYDSKSTPVARYIADRVLTLPLYPDLDYSNIDTICKIITGKRYF